MIDRKFWPEMLTNEVIMLAASPAYYHEHPGFCLACGHEQAGIEPGAERYLCEACGTRQGYGIYELINAAL